MFKRIFALLLCALMLIPCFAACSSKEPLTPGAQITMYLTDQTFDFDPANAYYNTETLNIVSMLYDTLFKLTDDGKIKPSLAKDYKFAVDDETGEHYMEITLNEAYWSNGSRLSAEDVVFAWKRLLKSDNKLTTGTDVDTQTNGGGTYTYTAASLLYDIKNARAVKAGDVSIERLGVSAEEIDVVKVVFEGEVDKDAFLLNLTSIATAPLYENYVTKNPDWAKKSSTILCSGPFKIGRIIYEDILNENGKNVTVRDDYAIDEDGKAGNKTSNAKKISYFYLERNVYYYRDTKRDPIDESVNPYRILVDCSMTDKQILDAYKEGKLFFVSDIPLSIRGDEFVKEHVEVTDSLSTLSLYLNQNAIIDDGADGVKLFANTSVRQALSLVIDREKIADTIVYAEAATGLVPNGVFEGSSYSKKQDFRSVGGELISTTANLAEAQKKLSEANIGDPSQYTIHIKVAAYDDVQIAAVELVAEAWRSLDFKVEVEQVYAIQNNDVFKEVGNEAPKDVCDNLLTESLQRKTYEVIAIDHTAFTADAYSMLSGFARAFSGMPVNMKAAEDEILQPHVTGYDSAAYNTLMEAIYYIPYVATTPIADEELKAAVDKIYSDNNITPTTDPEKWEDQKAILLHKAEELLIKEEMAIIPLVFNKNATMTSKDLSKVDSNFYVPALFKNAKLKNFEKYYYKVEKGEGKKKTTEIISIFDQFPNNINWEPENPLK